MYRLSVNLRSQGKVPSVQMEPFLVSVIDNERYHVPWMLNAR